MRFAGTFSIFFVAGDRHNGRNMEIRRRGPKVRQDENGKHVIRDLTGKDGKPVAGFSFPKDVPDRARKLRDQARILRDIAERLDRRAGELEENRSGGKVLHFLRRYLRKEMPTKTT